MYPHASSAADKSCVAWKSEQTCDKFFMGVFIDYTEILMKAVLCEEDNQQYSRDFSMLWESRKACVTVGDLCAGSHPSFVWMEWQQS